MLTNAESVLAETHLHPGYLTDSNMTRLPVVWARPKPNSPSQRVGVIDAVLSEDVDNFLFGATMVIQKCILSLFLCALSDLLTAR